MSPRWTPVFGAQLDDGGARLRVCAPAARRHLHVVVGARAPIALDRVAPAIFEGYVPDARAGERYRLQMDEHAPWPDPCSRFQPDGVHGASMVIDPGAFAWSDRSWRGVPRHALVIYELHVGTFTPEGTFAAAASRLPSLVDLGVTAVELMPIAAFPGTRNWGYDGGALFAPSEQYGRPDDVRAFVDAAHALGIAVLLDVVYNHLGPDGAYVAAFMPTILSPRHRNPWGPGLNFDGPGCAHVRRLICDNALHWLIEYHLDGLRLDATHAIVDESPEHILAQIAREVRAHVTEREVHLIAEDERNLAPLLHAIEDGGAGLTGVWADDFHHALRRHLAGDHEAWFADFAGTTAEIALAVRDGWIFSGQTVSRRGRPRGTSPATIPIDAPVICVQNHDQIGNRAHGERLHHQVGISAWLAASTLLLTAPETPMLFMGQEWAASSPFLFFIDHGERLSTLIVEGRRNEFSRFAQFSDVEARLRIPDPQSEQTWRASVLHWSERPDAPHAHVLAETRALLAIRHAHLMQEPRSRHAIRCEAAGPHQVWLEQPSAQGGHLLTFVDFAGAGPHRVPLGDEVHVGARATKTGGGAIVADMPVARLSGLRVLHATRPGLATATVHDVRVDGGDLVIEAAAAPFGLVLHLPGAAA